CSSHLDLEGLRLGLAPALPGRSYRFRIGTVEHQHNSLIAGEIRRHQRSIDEKAHRGAVWIVTVNRENDRLLARLRFAQGAVGKEAVLPKCPQVSIERVNPFLRSA